MSKLYIKPIIPINTRKDLIHCLYIENDGVVKWNANPTYYDEELTKRHCSRPRRSFDDLLLLSKTYFPETTEVDLMSTLVELNLSMLYCWTIHKIVFMGPTSHKGVKEGGFQAAVNDYLQTFGKADDFVIQWDPNTYTAEQLAAIHNQL